MEADIGRPARSGSRGWVWIAGLLVAAVVVFLAMRGRGAPAAPPAAQPQAPAAVAVSVATVERRDVRTVVQAAGALEAQQTVNVSSKAPGRVAQVAVGEGDRVRAGQVLVRLDASDALAQLAQARAALQAARARVPQASTGVSITERTVQEQRRQAQAGVDAAAAQVEAVRANVAAAEAALRRAQSDYQRVQVLAAEGAVAAQQVDAARTAVAAAQSQYDAARAQLEAAEGQLRAARATLGLTATGGEQVTVRQQDVEMARAAVRQAEAAVALAELQVRNTVITSPIAGVVIQRLVDPGEFAGPGNAVVVVADLSRVQMALEVSETDVARVRAGLPATITVDSLPGRQFSGTVASRSQAADARTRTFAVKVRLSNPDGSLRPGMFGRGTITASVVPNALVVPQDAVLYEGDRAYVYVVTADNRARRRPVTVGAREGLLVQVSGVAAGDRVIVQGQTLVRDGALVTVSQ